MKPLEEAACAHDWQPIWGWYARYKCATCRAIGYKPGAVHPQHARCMKIVPYRCEATRAGERCPEPAVHNWRGKKFRCAAHVGRSRTAEARKGLSAEPCGTAASGRGSSSIERRTNEIERGSNEIERRTNEFERGTNAIERRTNEIERGSNSIEPRSNETERGSNPTDTGSL